MVDYGLSYEYRFIGAIRHSFKNEVFEIGYP